MPAKRIGNERPAPSVIGLIRRNNSPIGVHVELPPADEQRRPGPENPYFRSTEELTADIERTLDRMSRRIDALAQHFNLRSHLDDDGPPDQPRAA